MKRLHLRPWEHRGPRLARLRDASLMFLAVAVLVVWNPLEHPGPKICLLRHGVALPCPLCGLTRGMALCLRGHPITASILNPLSVPLLLLMLLFGIKWMIEYAWNRRIDIVWSPGVVRTMLWLGYLAMLASWVYLLIWRREDDFADSWLGRLLM